MLFHLFTTFIHLLSRIVCWVCPFDSITSCFPVLYAYANFPFLEPCAFIHPSCLWFDILSCYQPASHALGSFACCHWILDFDSAVLVHCRKLRQWCGAEAQGKTCSLWWEDTCVLGRSNWPFIFASVSTAYHKLGWSAGCFLFRVSYPSPRSSESLSPCRFACEMFNVEYTSSGLELSCGLRMLMLSSRIYLVLQTSWRPSYPLVVVYAVMTSIRLATVLDAWLIEDHYSVFTALLERIIV